MIWLCATLQRDQWIAGRGSRETYLSYIYCPSRPLRRFARRAGRAAPAYLLWSAADLLARTFSSSQLCWLLIIWVLNLLVFARLISNHQLCTNYTDYELKSRKEQEEEEEFWILVKLLTFQSGFLRLIKSFQTSSSHLPWIGIRY